MHPWNIDADSINLKDQLDTEQLVINQDIQDFLFGAHKDSKFFIVGPKGYGKTLFLKAKSFHYRNQKSASVFIPQRELCEKMTKATIDFSADELNRIYSRLPEWEEIWKICLHILIIKHIDDIYLPREIEEVVKRASSLSNILKAILLDRRRNLHRMKLLLATELSPIVNKLNRSVAVFIDNIDEAFDHHVSNRFMESDSSQNYYNLSPQLWVNAQLGLINAVKSICLPNKHIKIFVSLRSEAFEVDDSPTHLQNQDYATQLSYNKQELRSIFENNIKLMSAKDLVNPEAVDPIERLLGRNIFWHRFIVDIHGKPKSEKKFDYIYRHTFQRPRELMLIGSKIARLAPQERTEEKIYFLVNELGDIILNQYRREIIPYFPSNIYDLFLKKLDKNVIPKQRAYEIAREIEDETGFQNVFTGLFRIGLVGYTLDKLDGESSLSQYFLPVARHTQNEAVSIFQKASYYLTHPCMDETLRKIKGESFYEKGNIIGKNYPFDPKMVSPDIHRHAHFGTDITSMGGAVPAFSGANCFALIQVNLDEWTEIQNCHGVFSYQLNYDDPIEFQIVHDGLSDQEFEKHLNDFVAGKSNLYIATAKSETLQKILLYTRTISLTDSFDMERCLELVKTLPNEPKRFVFPINFSDSSLRILEQILPKADTTQLEIRRTLLSRHVLTFDKPIVGDHEVDFYVEAETHHQINTVVLGNSNLFPDQFCEHLQFVQNEQRFIFYYLRHLLLVRGLYRFRRIAKTMRFNSSSRAKISEVFRQIQVMRLIDMMEDIDKAIIKRLFPGKPRRMVIDELEDFAKSTLHRMQGIPDSQKLVADLPDYISKIKQDKSVPSAKDFYHYYRSLDLKSRHAFPLIEIFQYPPDPDIPSVFISFNQQDDKFVNRIYQHLRLLGVKAFKYDQNDNNGGSLMQLMDDGVWVNDYILFVCSSDSLQSRYCQVELTNAREKQKTIWNRRVVIAARIDNFLFELKEYNIYPIDKREEYWLNIKMLKELPVENWSDLVNTTADHRIKGAVIKLVDNQISQIRN